MYVSQSSSSRAIGAALIGAGVFAAATIAPPAPSLQAAAARVPVVFHTDVALTAAMGPIATAYADLLRTTIGNLQTTAANFEPGLLLNQVIANQKANFEALGSAAHDTGQGIGAALSAVPQSLKAATEQLKAGDVAGAVNTLFSIPLAVVLPLVNLLPPLVSLVANPVKNIANALNVFADPLSDLLKVAGVFGPVISTVGALGVALQQIVTAVSQGDGAGAVRAILTAPAVIADGFFNGGYGPDLSPLAGIDLGLPIRAGGLFSPADVDVDADGNTYINLGGPFVVLQDTLRQITAAITPQVAAAAVAPTALAASTALPAGQVITLKLDKGVTSEQSSTTADPQVSEGTQTPQTDETPEVASAGSPIADADSSAASAAGSAEAAGTEKHTDGAPTTAVDEATAHAPTDTGSSVDVDNDSNEPGTQQADGSTPVTIRVSEKAEAVDAPSDSSPKHTPAQSPAADKDGSTAPTSASDKSSSDKSASDKSASDTVSGKSSRKSAGAKAADKSSGESAGSDAK